MIRIEQSMRFGTSNHQPTSEGRWKTITISTSLFQNIVLVLMTITAVDLPCDVVNKFREIYWYTTLIMKQNEDRNWYVPMFSSTTSSHFTNLISDILKHLGIQIMIRKGSIEQEAVETKRPHLCTPQNTRQTARVELKPTHACRKRWLFGLR